MPISEIDFQCSAFLSSSIPPNQVQSCFLDQVKVLERTTIEVLTHLCKASRAKDPWIQVCSKSQINVSELHVFRYELPVLLLSLTYSQHRFLIQDYTRKIKQDNPITSPTLFNLLISPPVHFYSQIQVSPATPILHVKRLPHLGGMMSLNPN
jgi:hypothetical protein